MLDQGQTIHVGTEDITLNSIDVQGTTVIRKAEVSGKEHRLTMGHTYDTQVKQSPKSAPVKGDFHKMQLASEVATVSGAAQPVIVTISIAHGGDLAIADVSPIATAALTYAPTVLARFLGGES